MTTEAEVRISAEVAEQHFAAKLKDALIAQQAAEIERLKAEAFDSTSMYNRCVDDVHAARAEIERFKSAYKTECKASDIAREGLVKSDALLRQALGALNSIPEDMRYTHQDDAITEIKQHLDGKQ